MNTFKKCQLGILALALVFTTACTGSNTPEGQGTSPEVKQVDTKPPVVKAVINNANRKFPEGMDENKNPYIQYIRDQTKIDLQLTIPPTDGYQDRLNVIMASGELPDLLSTKDEAFFVNYVNQKALLPLNESIDKYGPNLKKFISNEAWANVTIDGNIYAIPTIAKILTGEMMYVRKDWLDKLGLKAPKTLEEYTAVIQAFTEKDPDGNGKNDTMGLILDERLGKTQPFLGAFGVQRDQWYDRDGQLVYSGILPEMKQAIQYLAEQFKLKRIDPEWALNKSKNSDEKIASGKVGMYGGVWFSTRDAILTNQKNDPKAEWIRLEYPVGPNGKSGTKGAKIVEGYNLVPKTSKQVDAVVKLLDFLISEEAYKTLQFGFENQVYTIKDGVMVTNFDEHNKHIYRQSLHALVEPPYGDVLKERHNSLGKEFNLVNNVEFGHKHLINTQFLGTATPAMGKFNVKLSKMEEEYFTKFIMGAIPMEDFDKFVAEWKKSGGDEITKEVNDWYKASKTAKK
jgi:putative aldouronate transport system substrate-binding protein